MNDQTLLELNQKLDALSDQVALLTEEARIQRRRRQEWDELKNDLTPVANDVFRLSVQQLEEVDQYVQLEDILRLFKRLLRDTRQLEQMLNQMESFVDLWNEVSPITRDGFLAFMNRLDELERRGYFVFLQGGMEIFDRIVRSFSEEDVRQLGDNIVLILETVRDMTQPEIMNLTRQAAHIVAEEEPVDTSLRALLRQLNDPAVKRGLMKTLHVLRSVSDNGYSKN
ncbi:MAG: DUF1641 domain-containing protein [Chloroflexi bacterium]|nr:DUF1641 domain-containing protein [Chloroflexota bacterium]